MPGKPEIKEQAPPAAGAEGKVPVLVLARQDLLATFFVFSFDVPARPDDPERHLDAVCASVCTEVKGRRLDVKRATLGRFPGREMRFEYSEGSHVYIQTTRIYEAAPRVFVLGVAVPKEDHPAAYVPVFLDSFSLLKQ